MYHARGNESNDLERGGRVSMESDIEAITTKSGGNSGRRDSGSGGGVGGGGGGRERGGLSASPSLISVQRSSSRNRVQPSGSTSSKKRATIARKATSSAGRDVRLLRCTVIVVFMIMSVIEFAVMLVASLGVRTAAYGLVDPLLSDYALLLEVAKAHDEAAFAPLSVALSGAPTGTALMGLSASPRALIRSLLTRIADGSVKASGDLSIVAEDLLAANDRLDVIERGVLFGEPLSSTTTSSNGTSPVLQLDSYGLEFATFSTTLRELSLGTSANIHQVMKRAGTGISVTVGVGSFMGACRVSMGFMLMVIVGTYIMHANVYVALLLLAIVTTTLMDTHSIYSNITMQAELTKVTILSDEVYDALVELQYGFSAAYRGILLLAQDPTTPLTDLAFTRSALTNASVALTQLSAFTEAHLVSGSGDEVASALDTVLSFLEDLEEGGSAAVMDAAFRDAGRAFGTGSHVISEVFLNWAGGRFRFVAAISRENVICLIALFVLSFMVSLGYFFGLPSFLIASVVDFLLCRLAKSRKNVILTATSKRATTRMSRISSSGPSTSDKKTTITDTTGGISASTGTTKVLAPVKGVLKTVPISNDDSSSSEEVILQ